MTLSYLDCVGLCRCRGDRERTRLSFGLEEKPRQVELVLTKGGVETVQNCCNMDQMHELRLLEEPGQTVGEQIKMISRLSFCLVSVATHSRGSYLPLEVCLCLTTRARHRT